MAGKREKAEDIVLKLRQVEVLQGHGKSVSEAVRQIGVTQQTYYRWRREYVGMNRDQLATEGIGEGERVRRRRYATITVWRKNRQCTNIQIGPISGGRPSDDVDLISRAFVAAIEGVIQNQRKRPD